MKFSSCYYFYLRFKKHGTRNIHKILKLLFNQLNFFLVENFLQILQILINKFGSFQVLLELRGKLNKTQQQFSISMNKY